MDLIKKHASSFLQDKYKIARLAFTDVTEAELLAEEATNEDSCSPDPRTMTRIAEASYVVDEYWRIVDVLHGRLYSVDWKQWRQSYKALVLLEFLLTRGPLDFSQEFVCDTDVIHQLRTFQFIDQNGINWGANMQSKSDEILKLLGGKSTALEEARLRAIKVTKEIHGFGGSKTSTTNNSNNNHHDQERVDEKVPMTFTEQNNYSIRSEEEDDHDMLTTTTSSSSSSSRCTGNVEGLHRWDNDSSDINSTRETNSFLDDDDYEEYDEKQGFVNDGFVGGIFSKLTNTFSQSSSSTSKDYYGSFRSVSDVGRVPKKKYSRQSSLWY